jgi:small subunit ribosomal protein S3
MVKKYFVKQGIKEASIENFIRDSFPSGDYSRIELQSTPLGTKIIIYTNKPGKIIGRGGKNIDEITRSLKEKFEIENPQIDVKEIENPDLDAKIVAKQIKSAIERGYNYKKIGNIVLRRIMDAGALGAEIIISGKLSGSKAMKGKFVEGHIKHSGELSKTMVDTGYEEAHTKPGIIGIKVRIMKESLDITGNIVRKTEAKKTEEEIAEELKKIAEESLKASEEKKE